MCVCVCVWCVCVCVRVCVCVCVVMCCAHTLCVGHLATSDGVEVMDESHFADLAELKKVLQTVIVL